MKEAFTRRRKRDVFALGKAIWSVKNFIQCIELANLMRKRRVFIAV